MRIESEILKTGNVGIEYVDSIRVTGGSGAISSLAITSGNLPDGLQRNGLEIRGTPTVPGNFSFTFEVQTSGQPMQTATRELSILIENKIFVPLFNHNLPLGVINEAYEEEIPVVGGVPPFIFTITSGRLPAGLLLDQNSGVISGTPTETTLTNLAFFLEIQDSSSPPQTALFRLKITIHDVLQIRPDPLPDGFTSESYSGGHIKSFGGRPPYSIQLVSGSLPAGLDFLLDTSSLGVFIIAGVPESTGTSTFTVAVSDSSTPPGVIQQQFSIRINEQIILLTESLPEGIVGTPYDFTLESTGGLLPIQWVIINCPGLGCPEGLTLEGTTGRVSGTPTAEFNSSTRVSSKVCVRDSSLPAQADCRDLFFFIYGFLDITTTKFPPVKVGHQIRFLPGIIGGKLPITWAIDSGQLPAGLTFDSSTGEIFGTASNSGTSQITVRVDDSGNGAIHQFDTQNLTIDIRGSLGRNDSIATATPISNGTFSATISPYADPAETGNPDSDFYELSANAGNIVSIEIFANRLTILSTLDSVIEIVDQNGTRFISCRDPGNDFFFGPILGDTTRSQFDDACVNDDMALGFNTDSALQFEVPGNPGDIVTFFVRVLDFRGDARPDFAYEINISGSN